MAAKKEETPASQQEQAFNQVQRRLDLLDQRLDNIDSVVSAVVERVMKQPITLNVTCSHCGHNIEIAIVGTHKPVR